MSHPALVALYALRYSDSWRGQANDAVRAWLQLETSMTERFEKYCRQVSVEVVSEGFVSFAECADAQFLLPEETRYWRREIVLYGDGVPWLAGMTLVPESTLSGPDIALQQLGETPLGRYLFANPALTRDFIEFGRNGDAWGRRSRLRLAADKPLLLSELFLPASPLYQEEQAWSGV